MTALKTDLRGLIAFLLGCLALLVAAPTAAQDFPARPEGPVLDAAEILPPSEEAALDQRLRAYNQETGRAIVVATVTGLEGLPIDMYAQQLAEQWDIGGAETEEGVLMVVAPNDREIWITTARGVQARLTDVSTGRIVRNTIIPQFKDGNMPAGILAGVEAIIERLNMDPAQAEAIAEAEAAAERDGGVGEGATIGGVIFWIAMIGLFAFIFGRRGRRRHRRYGVGSAVGDVILWHAIGSALGGASRGSHGSSGFGGLSGGGGFGGFGGGGGGFSGGGAGGSW